MSQNATHVNAPQQSVEAGEMSFGYRRFGRPSPFPLVFLQHFRGNLDNWDPMLTGGLAAQRDVILVDYAGAGSSTGQCADTVAGIARQMITFTEALQLPQIDLFGYSVGGFVAQEIALIRPMLVRKLILAGTGPQGAPGMHGWRQDIEDHARDPQFTAENLLYIFFAHTPTSQAKGMEYLGRFQQRAEDRDPLTNLALRDAQYDAVVDWGIPDHSKLQRLTGIKSPTLILQGDNDLMIWTKQSHLMAGLIPDAQIRIFPDAAHGSIFQYAEEAAGEINSFLDR
jgi:pimeloyl-ACP methyl ester carboxylesterase